jgi:hypothetical protein
MVRHLEREPQNIEHGMLKHHAVTWPRKVVKKVRKTANPDVGQGPVREEMQATTARGFWWLLPTSRGRGLRIPFEI